MTTLVLTPVRYHLRRVIGYLPEPRANTILRRLNIILGRYPYLGVDHPLIAARDDLAYALSTGDGIDTAAMQAARVIVQAAARGEGRDG